MTDIIINVGAIVILILPIFSVLAAFRLWRLTRKHSELIALRERAQMAGVLAVGSVFGLLVSLNRLWNQSHPGGDPLIASPITVFLMLGIVLSTSIPNIVWLYRFRTKDDT